MEKMLPYSRAHIAQDTTFFCGPASAQTVIFAWSGTLLPEVELAQRMGTDQNGTDHIGLIAPVLNEFLPDGDYRTVQMPNDPPTDDQAAQLWTNVKRSIDAGFGCVANIVAPPTNYPKGVRGSSSPQYSGGTVFHYIAIMGYAEDDDGFRAFWIADSGFPPFGYWCSFAQMATLIPPKGYAYATGGTPVATPVSPASGTLYGIDISNHQGIFDVAQAKREGYTFFGAKVTEGATFKDQRWPRNRDLAREHFAGLFCGYHFATIDDPIDAQVENLQAHLGDANIPVYLDYEDVRSHGKPSGKHMRDLITAIDGAGMRVWAVYLPRWYWRDRMGSPDLTGIPPVWNSHFVDGSGFGSALYPGKDFAGWRPFADGVPVRILQFSERGRVAGQFVDVDAFEGTLDELRTLLSGAPGKPGIDDCVLDNWLQLLGPQGNGWAQLNDKSIVDALALIGVHLDTMATAPTGPKTEMTTPTGAPNPMALRTETLARARDVWDQLRGPWPGNEGWKQLGNRTIVDAVAAIAERLGVQGFGA